MLQSIKKRILPISVAMWLLTSVSTVMAGTVDFVNVRLQAIQTNFTNAEVAINDNDARIAQLESMVQQLMTANADLQAQIDNLQAPGGVAGLSDFVSVEVDEYGYPAVVFDSVNVHIRNGNPSTAAFANNGSNGLGNLIIGYNTPPSVDILGEQCSGGFFQNMWTGVLPTQETCEAGGYVWSNYHKSGSHNLIVGPEHSYTGANNIVGGVGNMALDGMNLVTGSFNLGGFAGVALNGTDNRAYFNGTILGSGGNAETGFLGIVIGGLANTANERAIIVGGEYITATDEVVIDGEPQ